MKRTMLICLCVSAFALFPRASLAEITGTPPNTTGDTVINEDTVWRGENIVLGRNLTVNWGKSLTIDACDVLFTAVWPNGKMTSQTGTTIVIKNSYVHGQDEVNRAYGIVLGGGNDMLTIKISGVTFKYMGGYPNAMVTAPANYTTGSYFRGNSFIRDSRTNSVWGFTGVGRYAGPEKQGIKVEDCYFFQIWQGVSYQRYLYDSTLRGCLEPINVPPAGFVMEGNRFYDNTGKSINLFNQSSNGLIRDNFMYNTTICLVDLPGAADNLFENNLMVGIESSYIPGWREVRAAGGTGDGNIFVGNEFVGFTQNALDIAGGNNWLVAGNKITDCFGGTIGMRPYQSDRGGVPGPGKSGGNAVVIGNIIKRCYAGGCERGMIGIRRWSTTSPEYIWDGAVIAGNTIKDNLFYAPPRGIKLSIGENILVKKNIIQNNSVGIEISEGVTSCYIVDNDISGNIQDMIGEEPSSPENLPQAEIVSPLSNEFEAGQPVTFQGAGTAKGGKTIVSYWWFFGDDGKTSEEQNPTHTSKKDGTYFVCLIVTDSAGLKDVAVMPGRIEAVWNQEDPKRPWPGKKPRLAAYPNPLYLNSINVDGAAKPVFVLYYYRGKPSLKIYDSENNLVREFEKFSMNAEEFDNFTIVPWVKKISLDFYECLVEWDLKDDAGEQVPPGKYLAITLDGDDEIARCRFFYAVAVTSEVNGRHVFYNNSAFDGDNPAANADDDGAVAPDKTALLPGGTATFANYTSYSRGINGIMIDIAGLPDTPTAADFIFKVGNDSTTGSWGDAPAPTSITVREGAGIDGADRITIIWADNAIQKQWLQITVKATDATGLASGDVFYFGNAIGETGDSAANAMVTPTDGVGARNNSHGPPNPAGIDDVYDFDRDKLVIPTDEILTRNNATNPITALKLIIVP